MIHKFKMNGKAVVLDVESSAVFNVDDLVYDILDYYEHNTLDEIIEKLNGKYEDASIKEAFLEITELKEKGMLFSEDEYFTALDNVLGREPVVKALCLNVAHDCNLKCAYCFAEEGEYGGKRSLMSLEVGKQAIDFLIKSSGKRKNLEIDFFGGEPLMNFDVVKGVVEYARSKEAEHNKNFRFTITTNGILLDEEKQAYINEHMHNVVLSIDGRKETNDKMRLRYSGDGCYDNIVPKFQRLAESRNQTNYYVRGTFTSKNVDFAQDVLHLADLGFKQVSVEPVVAESDKDYAIKTEDVAVLCEQYEVLAAEMDKRKNTDSDFNFFHFSLDLMNGPCVAKRLIGCGAGTEYLAVTPDGSLFACHQFVGNEDYKMGTVYEGVTNKEKRNELLNLTIYKKPKCLSCFAKYYCSGGCVANAVNQNGDNTVPYDIGCELQKKRTECGLMLSCQ